MGIPGVGLLRRIFRRGSQVEQGNRPLTAREIALKKRMVEQYVKKFGRLPEEAEKEGARKIDPAKILELRRASPQIEATFQRIENFLRTNHSMIEAALRQAGKQVEEHTNYANAMLVEYLEFTKAFSEAQKSENTQAIQQSVNVFAQRLATIIGPQAAKMFVDELLQKAGQGREEAEAGQRGGQPGEAEGEHAQAAERPRAPRQVPEEEPVGAGAGH